MSNDAIAYFDEQHIFAFYLLLFSYFKKKPAIDMYVHSPSMAGLILFRTTFN